ncbi:MAG TPA: PspC domain-containing protein [Bacteroidota bacterium]|nr:PspC domain-containing protein [Bacteroidota bacterium]
MRHLYRSRAQKVIGGVAGGIGEYLDIDPVLVRILFVVAFFAGGVGVLAYIIAWIIIPEQPKETTMTMPSDPQQTSVPPQPSQPPKPEERHHRGSVVGGLVLLVLGLLFLGQNFLPDFNFGDWWPLILVAIGAGLLYKAIRPSHS